MTEKSPKTKVYFFFKKKKLLEKHRLASLFRESRKSILWFIGESLDSLDHLCLLGSPVNGDRTATIASPRGTHDGAVF